MATIEKTKVTQESKQLPLADGTFKYTIRTTVIEKGELPHPNLFVFKISDPNDPKDDAFERVGNPYDLENTILSRDAALLVGAEYYLDTTMLKEYTELEVAVQAKAAIVSRVEESVNAWITYMSDFAGTSDVYHPTGDPGLEESLVIVYTDAKAARVAAEEDVVSAEADIVLAEAVAALAAEKVSIYQKQVEFCADASQVYWANYYAAVGGYTQQMSTFMTASEYHSVDYQNMWTDVKEQYNNFTGEAYPANPGGAYSALWSILQKNEQNPAAYQNGALDTIKKAQTTFQQNEKYGASLNDACAAFCGAATASYNVAAAEKSLKDIEVANAVTAKENANAVLVAAQTAEDAALTAILALCPTFDPNSV